MNKAITRLLVGIPLSLAVTAASVAAEKAPDMRSADPATACAHMMHSSGIIEQGKKTMQEFMQSPRAPEAMGNMMAVASRMSNGDVMLGMTKMMDMMGPMGGGGMMGGEGGMMQPGKPSEK
jgi:hypothetical protein